MARDKLGDFLAFIAVAQARSFTRAASQLGMAPSTLSHTIRTLESRMGVRLLNRTTRGVSVTEAGDRLLQAITPKFEEIEAEITAVSDLGDTPSGTVRITTTDFAAELVLWPQLTPLLVAHPQLKLEMSVDYRLTDIVAERFDIGVRWGDQVAKDMIAVRISPDLRMVVVGAPAYLGRQALPRTPRDLLQHNCITLRMASSGGVYAWELSRGGKEVEVRVGGQATFNGVHQMINAAVDGCGLAFVPQVMVDDRLRAGSLVAVLEDWSPTFPGLHIYFPNRRQPSRALQLVIDALRYRAPSSGDSPKDKAQDVAPGRPQSKPARPPAKPARPSARGRHGA